MNFVHVSETTTEGMNSIALFKWMKLIRLILLVGQPPCQPNKNLGVKLLTWNKSDVCWSRAWWKTHLASAALTALQWSRVEVVWGEPLGRRLHWCSILLYLCFCYDRYPLESTLLLSEGMPSA